MNRLLLHSASFLMFVLMALFSESAQAQDQPWLGLVPVVEHTEGELAGMTTYRLYLYTLGENDFLVSCSGDSLNPLAITSTSEPSWFQHELPTTPFATDINTAFFSAVPELVYDSWLTIGVEDSTPPTIQVSSAPLTNSPFYEAFESGEDIEVSDQFGAAWFVFPTSGGLAVSGDDFRVLVAQLTTAGDISGQIQVQVFLNNDNNNEFRQTLPILTACNDPEALNYEQLSFNNDGCQYAPVDVVVERPAPMAFEAFPSPANATATVVFPAAMQGKMAGTQLQATAMDGRLVQSWDLHSTTQTVDVQDLASGQYVLSVAGLENAALRLQGQLVILR